MSKFLEFLIFLPLMVLTEGLLSKEAALKYVNRRWCAKFKESVIQMGEKFISCPRYSPLHQQELILPDNFLLKVAFKVIWQAIPTLWVLTVAGIRKSISVVFETISNYHAFSPRESDKHS